MKNETIDLIEKLRATPWFVHVGEPGLGGVFLARSWEEVAQICEETEDLFLTIREDYVARLERSSKCAWRSWNEVVQRVRPNIQALVTPKIQGLAIDERLRSRVDARARWEVMHAAVEIEFSDVIPPAFFTSLMPWYLQGRFPCGWVGEYPAGQLAVY